MAERVEDKNKNETNPSLETGGNGAELQPRKSEKPTFLDWIRPREKREKGFEAEDWLSKIEKDPQQIKNQQMGNNASPLQAVGGEVVDVFEIPITREKFVRGLKQSIDDAARWLSTFLLRIVKKKDGKVKFKQENGSN